MDQKAVRFTRARHSTLKIMTWCQKALRDRNAPTQIRQRKGLRYSAPTCTSHQYDAGMLGARRTPRHARSPDQRNGLLDAKRFCSGPSPRLTPSGAAVASCYLTRKVCRMAAATHFHPVEPRIWTVGIISETNPDRPQGIPSPLNTCVHKSLPPGSQTTFLGHHAIGRSLAESTIPRKPAI